MNIRLIACLLAYEPFTILYLEQCGCISATLHIVTVNIANVTWKYTIMYMEIHHHLRVHLRAQLRDQLRVDIHQYLNKVLGIHCQ